MESDEECFSGDEVDQFSCPKHQQMYTNYCCTTHSLLCSECLLKYSVKMQNVITIEKALTNIAAAQKSQLSKIQKVIKNYNQLDEEIQRDQGLICQFAQNQLNSINSVCAQLSELVHSKFAEIAQEIELHKHKILQLTVDQKVILDEYRSRAVHLERNILYQQKSSGYDQLRKAREFHMIFTKTIKELDQEYEELLNHQRPQYKQLPIKLPPDFHRQFSALIGSVERDSEISKQVKKVVPPQNPVSNRVSPLSSRKGITQHCSPGQAPNYKVYLARPSHNKNLLQPAKSQALQSTKEIANDISSIIDNQPGNDPEQSMQLDFKEYFAIKQSLSDTMLSRMELPIQTTSQYYLIGGKLKESSQNLIEIVDITNKTSHQYDFLVSHRSGFQTALVNNITLLIGGKQEGVRTALCEQYDPLLKELKISQLILTKGMSGFASQQIGNRLYICGGQTDSGFLDTFQQVNLQNFQSKPLAQVPIKCSGHTLNIGNDPDTLYLIHEAGCYRYQIQSNAWQKLRQPTFPRRNHAAITLPDGIWIFGGRCGKKYIKQVERYDEQEEVWKVMGELALATIKLDAIQSEDFQFVYLFGGKTQEGNSSQLVWRYSILSNQCSQWSQFMKGRYGHRVVKRNSE